jgi:hypothetical protein
MRKERKRERNKWGELRGKRQVEEVHAIIKSN